MERERQRQTDSYRQADREYRRETKRDKDRVR